MIGKKKYQCCLFANSLSYRLMKGAVLFMFLFAGIDFGQAQDQIMANYLNTPAITNPALFTQNTSLQFSLSQRNQSFNSISYNTLLLSLSSPIIVKQENYFGNYGVSILNERQGTGLFQNLGALLAYSYGVKINHKYRLSFAIQTGFMQNGFGNIRTAQQRNINGIFDPSLPSGEPSRLQTQYWTLASGMIFTWKSPINRAAERTIGFSLRNLNQPLASIDGYLIPFKIPINHTLFAHYDFIISRHFILRPQGRWIKRTGYQPKNLYEGGINGQIVYEDKIALQSGLAYNSQNGFILNFQMDIKEIELRNTQLKGLVLNIYYGPSNIIEFGFGFRLANDKMKRSLYLQEGTSYKPFPNFNSDFIPSNDLTFNLEPLPECFVDELAYLPSPPKAKPESDHSHKELIGEAKSIDFKVDFKFEGNSSTLDEASLKTFKTLAYNIKFFYETKIVIIAATEDRALKMRDLLLERGVNNAQIVGFQVSPIPDLQIVSLASVR